MNLARTKESIGGWLQWILTVLGSLLVGLCIYTLSLGPVLKLCGFKRSIGWGGLPVAVQIIYGPLANVPAGPLRGVLEKYFDWWIDLGDQATRSKPNDGP